MKKLISLALALTLCLSLTVPALAAGETAVKDRNGAYTFGLSQPVLETQSSLSVTDALGSAQTYADTVYVVPMSAEVTIPAGFSGTLLLCIEAADDLWLPVAYLPLNGEGGSCIFDAPVYLPDSRTGGLTYRGTIAQNSDRAMMIVSQSQDNSKREIEPIEDVEVSYAGDVAGYMKQEVICFLGVKNYVTASAGFADVPADSPFAGAIAWAVEKGITNGTTPTTFGPSDTCTISHILTFLWRAAGRPGDGGNERNAVTAWARSLDIDTSSLNTPCTRAEAVTYLWKAAGSPAPDTAIAFDDVSGGADYAGAVAWAVEQGITTGTSANTFSPASTCTRGQIVTFLYRARH